MANSSLREMIRPAMAVAAILPSRAEMAEYARDARLARVGALVLDGIFLSVVYAFVNGVYGVTVVPSGYITDTGGSYTTVTSVPWTVLGLIGIVYFILLEGMFGATLGKQVMRLKVVRLDGGRLSAWSIIARNVLRLVDFLPVLYLLGGVFVLVTPGAQRIGDLVAGTTVVYRHRARRPGATRTADRRARSILLLALAAVLLYSAGFDYFGRPSLVIAGLHNTRQLPAVGVESYWLGAPAWGWGQVTYPVTYATQTGICSGTLTLRWQGSGWQLTAATTVCPP